MARLTWVCRSKRCGEYSDTEIMEMVKLHNGNKAEAAHFNNLGYSTLLRRVKQIKEKERQTP